MKRFTPQEIAEARSHGEDVIYGYWLDGRDHGIPANGESMIISGTFVREKEFSIRADGNYNTLCNEKACVVPPEALENYEKGLGLNPILGYDQSEEYPMPAQK